MLADYHLHSAFSDDSIEPMENQIEQAIARGFDEICFTEHVDYGIKKDWDEGNFEYRENDPRPWLKERKPMTNCNYPEYFAHLARMKERYAGRITIRQGLEFGIQQITLDRYEKLWETWKDQLDFVILSVHEVNNTEFWQGEFMKGRTRTEYNRLYYTEILECMKRFPHYSVLGHLDSINRYEPNGIIPFEEIEDLVTEILQTAIRDGKGIEINTSGLRKANKEAHPSDRILQMYKEMGGRILTIGSDAHVREDLGFRIPETQEHLKNDLKTGEFCTFVQMSPVFHTIG